jgi:hypothetical protein
MDDYTAAADKLNCEMHHLDRVLDSEEPNFELAISIAKRARRHCNVLVRALARERDSYSPKEGTSDE